MKFFRKLFVFLVAFAVGFAVFGCTLNVEDVEVPEEFVPGITAAVQTFTQKVGDKFEPFNGVQAIDSQGNNMLDQVEVSHLIPLDNENHLLQSGTYQIKYVLKIGDLIYNYYRTLIVEFEMPDTDDIIVNGDFEFGATDPFTKSEFDNGGATLSVVEDNGNHLLKVEVNSVSWQAASPRLETNVFTLEAGKYYKLSFEAKALEARPMLVQLGELLSAAPWFNGLLDTKVQLTTEMQKFEVEFMADSSKADLTKLQALFGFGTIDGSDVATTVFMDNLKVEETKVPTLIEMSTLLAGLNDEAAAANANAGSVAVWYDQGGWCGAASTCESSMDEEGLHLDATQPERSCWFATQLFVYSGELVSGYYTLSVDVELSKAGKITLGANSAPNASIAFEVFDAVQGSNHLEIKFNVADGQRVGLSLQFGDKKAETNIGDFSAVVSNAILLRTGDVFNPDYADPDKILDISSVQFGGEGDAKNTPNVFNVWYVQSADWNCGPVVNTTYKFEKGILEVETSQTDEHWWFANQIFVYSKAIEAAGTHKVTFNFASSIAGKFTINGKLTPISVGDNLITLDISNAAGAPIGISIQFGFEEVLEGGETVSHTVVGKFGVKIADLKVDGVPATSSEGGNEEPQKFLGLPLTVKNGERSLAQENHGTLVYWYDNNWCGSKVTATTTVTAGILTLDITKIEGSCWFGTQLFWYGDSFENDKDFSFTLKSTVAGKITFNGKVFDLVEGDNTISVVIAKGTPLLIDFQAGADGVGQIGTGKFIFSYFQVVDHVEVPGESDPITLYTEGEGEKAIHIDGAGAWIWFKPSLIGMTAENQAQFKVTATCDKFNVVEVLFSNHDYTADIARIYVVMGGAPTPGDLTTISLTVTDPNDKVFKVDVHFEGTAFINEGAGGDPVDPGTGGDPVDPGTGETGSGIVLYTAGEGNNAIHIEGAGAWIWVKPSSMGMTAENQNGYKVFASCTTLNVVEAFFSDHNYTNDVVRIYVLLSAAPAADAETIINISIVDAAGGLLTKDVRFVGNAYAPSNAAGGEGNPDDGGQGGQGNPDDGGQGGQGGQEQTNREIVLYTEGEGQKSIHIEGAGVWIWLKASSLGMTAENQGSFSVRASCKSAGVREAFFSDHDYTNDYVRVYVVLEPAPANDATVEVTINVVTPESEMLSKTLTFVSGVYSPEA